MTKIHIVGNPNSGKTTLFNSITKSSEHVGNWHGVTVDKKSKLIKFNDEEYELIDLPGIYSLNAYSLEEQVSIDEINLDECNNILYLMDANNFKRSMLLAINLLIANKNIKILINNYKSFEKSGKSIDAKYLQQILGCQVEIIDAQKIKINQDFFKFKTKNTAFIKTLQNQINNKKENSEINNIENIYKYILKISNNCIKNKKENKINTYGYNVMDNKLLRISVYLPIFIILMFSAIYLIFFIVGPIISGWFLNFLYFLIQKPVMSVLKLATKSKFIIALFDEGVFGACFSVLGFLPQIACMYLFLSMLENSGLISRMAFVFDDLLEKVGLNGKMVYTLLMGFGCSTTATISAKNMADKNSKIKASLLTPLISCSAKLPIYSVVAGALFGVNSIWLIFGLYLLGIILAVVLGIVFEHTILPTGKSNLLIEFPPIRVPQIKNIWMSVKGSCRQFVVKVFGVIFGFSLMIWLLSNINIQFKYVGDSTKSILYSFSSIISWIFKPIGLNNPNIVCALLIGLVAKELIISNFAISNKVSSLNALGASLLVASNPVNFTIANGISFLVFTLLYLPCISNFGVLLKEVGSKFTWFSIVLQFSMAYLISYLIYIAISEGLGYMFLILSIILLTGLSVYVIYKKIKSKKILCNCINCNKCKK